MLSGIVLFDEVIESIKDATGIENMRPLYDRVRRFIFTVENDIGPGGVIVVKNRQYNKNDGMYDGKTLVLPMDFMHESGYGALTDGRVYGNIYQLYNDGPDQIDFRYLGYALDEFGNPFTTRNRLDAVVAYAVYRLYSSRVFTKQGSANMYKMYQQEYYDAVLQARGNDAFPTEEEWSELGATKNGGAFEAITNCGMRTIYSGSNNPILLDAAPVIEKEGCVTTVEAVSTSFATVSAIITQLTRMFIVGVSNSFTNLYGNIWDKDTMVGVSNGASSWIDANLTSPTEATGTTIQISGNSNGKAINSGVFAVKGRLVVRSLGQSTTISVLTVQAILYSFQGIYEYPDPINPLGGVVTYIDVYGNEQTAGNIWAPEVLSVLARSIISATGVAEVLLE